MKVGIIGSGAFGTAVAATVERAGHDVTLWARENDVVDSINNDNENACFLKGIELSPFIKATGDIKDMLKQDFLFLATPSQFLGDMCENLRDMGLSKDTPLIIVSKGVLPKTLQLMSEVVEDILPDNPLASLAGPSFAKELAQNKPTWVTIASKDKALAEKISALVEHVNFNTSISNDLIGAEVGSAIKNVIAIACGIAQGKDLGQNAHAALITQGLKEISALSKAKGGDPETALELCNVGDLVLTCSSMTSRNMSFGNVLGEGKPLEDILEERKQTGVVTEGYGNAETVVALAKKLGIGLPICEAMQCILYKKDKGDLSAAAQKYEALLNPEIKQELAPKPQDKHVKRIDREGKGGATPHL